MQYQFGLEYFKSCRPFIIGDSRNIFWLSCTACTVKLDILNMYAVYSKFPLIKFPTQTMETIWSFPNY